MADEASKEAAVKLRIITHMNNDHQDSLVRYLEHFCGLSSFAARNARMNDMTFEELSVQTSPQEQFRIPVKPPMTTWSEARPRVVAMDQEAVAALGRSSITVKVYKAPRGIALGFCIFVIITLLAFSTRANFESGSVLFSTLLHLVPNYAHFCWIVQPWVLSVILGVHGAEMAWMARTRLAKHSVPSGSSLWYQWMANVSIEGFGAVIRFDRIVKEEAERKANAKH